MMQRFALSALAILPLCMTFGCEPMDLNVGDKDPAGEAGKGASTPDDEKDPGPGVIPGKGTETPNDGKGGSGSEPAYFACLDGQSKVPVELVCNSKKECADGSDEIKCQPTTPFTCADGKTDIAPTLVCNGKGECPDASDEKGCPVNDPGYFVCKDQSNKLDQKQVCDGIADCKDKSDELDCSGPHIFVCKDQSNKLDQSQVCDHVADCNDKSDELSCEENICHEGIDEAPRFDEKLGCLLPREVIGCTMLIHPDDSVPSYWPGSTCLHRKVDGALFLVPEPQLATEWQDCTEEEIAKVADVASCK